MRICDHCAACILAPRASEQFREAVATVVKWQERVNGVDNEVFRAVQHWVTEKGDQVRFELEMNGLDRVLVSLEGDCGVMGSEVGEFEQVLKGLDLGVAVFLVGSESATKSTCGFGPLHDAAK